MTEQLTKSKMELIEKFIITKYHSSQMVKKSINKLIFYQPN